GYLAAPQTVLVVRHQVVQRHHHVVAGHVGGDVVGVGDADVGGGAGGNVGDDIVVDVAVVGVEAQGHRDVGIEGLEILNGLLVDVGLVLVGVVFGPEGDLVIPGCVEGLRHREGRLLPAAVTAGEEGKPHNQSRPGGKD